MNFKLIICLGVILMLLTSSLAPAVGTTDPSKLEKTENSAQSKNGKFLGKDVTMSIKNAASSFWRFFFEKNDKTPKMDLPGQRVDLSHFKGTNTGQLNSTWLGHSSLMINISGYRILTDPVFEKKVSLVGPTRFNGDLPLDTDQLPDIDVVIVSHDHYDHLNKYSIQRLKNVTKKFIVPLKVGKRLSKWGIPDDKIIELDWWETYNFDENLKITATPAQHFSGRGLGDRNKTLWASWVIASPDHNLFFSGDSGYFDGFKTIGDTYGPFDMTFLECGAYDKLWRPVHMFPEETAQAHLDLRGKLLHPIHWGTFNLALHPWYEPMQRLSDAARSSNISIATPVVGETIVHGTQMLGSRWWEKALENAPEDALSQADLFDRPTNAK
jgi:L-ascorbate metabolism protein UlaG (beta-lactamase superfamily)